MVTDIKFIKTNREGKNLQIIQESYPNSIINVDSQSEKNVYIGDYRITDNYNLGLKYENSITNSVGGISSGINASEFKGKSISEILDRILFASDNNLTLKGVVVVDKIENLTDDTLKDVYKGMVVSVLEDNSLYILLTDSDERSWKKIGSDSETKLSAPITVAGLPDGIFGAGIENGKEYTTENTIEDILRDLLCKENYPDVKLVEKIPTIGFNFATKKYDEYMEVGTILELDEVELNIATIDGVCSRVGSGFKNGYSTDLNKDNIVDDKNPPEVKGTSSLAGEYSLTESYSPSSIGKIRTSNPSTDYKNVRFNKGSVTIVLDENKINIKAKSPRITYTLLEYPEYYVVSNLGNLSNNNKLEKRNSTNGTVNPKECTSEIKIIGVYPVYVNIDSNNSFVNEPIKMNPQKGPVFTFIDVPSEVEYKIHFKFDYPSSHSLVSFKIKEFGVENFVDYESTYEIITLENKVINGVKYNRLQTTGALQGPRTYQITLSESLNKDKQ